MATIDNSRKILQGLKYPIYHRSYKNSPDIRPNLAEAIIDLLVDEGVPRDLIRVKSSEFGFLDFEASVDNPFNPKSVKISICTFFRKQENGFQWVTQPIFEISFHKAERDRLYRRTATDNRIQSIQDQGPSTKHKVSLELTEVAMLNEHIDSVIQELQTKKEVYARGAAVLKGIYGDGIVAFIVSSLVHEVVHNIRHRYGLGFFRRHDSRLPSAGEQEEIQAIVENRTSEIVSTIESLHTI